MINVKLFEDCMQINRMKMVCLIDLQTRCNARILKVKQYFYWVNKKMKHDHENDTCNIFVCKH